MDFEHLRMNIDTENLYSVIDSFPHQFEEARAFIESDFVWKLPNDIQIDQIVASGMGGSSLPVDMINDMYRGDFHIVPSRTYDIPEWVDKNTLVFVNSYSGNTEETLEALEEVRQHTAHIIIITAGGELLQKAQEYGITYYQIPDGLQPRCASGYFLVYIMDALFRLGKIGAYNQDMIDLVNFLQHEDFHLEAKHLAQCAFEKLPIIYADERYASIARIWKIKINENAKTQCFWNVYPELNHNEMVGFTILRTDPVFFQLDHPSSHARIRNRMKIFARILGKKTSVYAIAIRGNTLLQQIVSTVVLGDWVSYYLALLNGVNPTPVDMVEEFKELMKEI